MPAAQWESPIGLNCQATTTRSANSSRLEQSHQGGFNWFIGASARPPVRDFFVVAHSVNAVSVSLQAGVIEQAMVSSRTMTGLLAVRYPRWQASSHFVQPSLTRWRMRRPAS